MPKATQKSHHTDRTNLIFNYEEAGRIATGFLLVRACSSGG